MLAALAGCADAAVEAEDAAPVRPGVDAAGPWDGGRVDAAVQPDGAVLADGSPPPLDAASPDAATPTDAAAAPDAAEADGARPTSDAAIPDAVPACLPRAARRHLLSWLGMPSPPMPCAACRASGGRDHPARRPQPRGSLAGIVG
ncbi:MAG: hypothetical protein R3F43_32370 [bacterium]